MASATFRMFRSMPRPGTMGICYARTASARPTASGQLVNAELVGGTSAGAPTFAAIMALIAQKTNSRQGQANFVLYPLAAGQNAANCNSSLVHNLNAFSTTSPRAITMSPVRADSPATAGYDLATGWGSVNAANLAANWQNATFRSTITKLQLSSANLTHGQPVTASASVTPSTGAGTPTGDVALLTGGSVGVNLGNLSSGSVSGAVRTLPGGSYSVTASYGGDGTFGASTSTGVPITISPETSTTTFSAFLAGQSGNPSSPVETTYGNFLDFQVDVAGASKQGTPTGTLTFSDAFNGSTSTLLERVSQQPGQRACAGNQARPRESLHQRELFGRRQFFRKQRGSDQRRVAKGPTQTILFLPTGALPNSSVDSSSHRASEWGHRSYGHGAIFHRENGFGECRPTQELDRHTYDHPTGNRDEQHYRDLFRRFQLSRFHFRRGHSDGRKSRFSKSAANPGNVIISGSVPGASNLLLTPGPGLGFCGRRYAELLRASHGFFVYFLARAAQS